MASRPHQAYQSNFHMDRHKCAGSSQSGLPCLDSIWAEMGLLLEWKQGFGFYIVLGDDPLVSGALRQRVEGLKIGGNRPLQWVRPEHAETLVGTVLNAVLPSSQTPQIDQYHAESHSPVWLDLTFSGQRNDQLWHIARNQALATLNRGRSRLEQHQKPLFLQVPLHMAPDIVMWAPDLWSIREYVALLPTATAQDEVDADAGTAPEARPPDRQPYMPTQLHAPFTKSSRSP